MFEYNRKRPVVCVCQINGLAGLVLKEDLEQASKIHWTVESDKWRRALKEHNLSTIANMLSPAPWRAFVRPVFVFHPDSNGFRSLRSTCFVEEAVFFVPTDENSFSITATSDHNILEFEKAYQHFFGEPYQPRGELVAGGMET